MSEPGINPPQEPAPKDPFRENPRTGEILTSQSLFQGQREIWIEHDGVRYRLRITRRNKLILQK